MMTTAVSQMLSDVARHYNQGVAANFQLKPTISNVGLFVSQIYLDKRIQAESKLLVQWSGCASPGEPATTVVLDAIMICYSF